MLEAAFAAARSRGKKQAIKMMKIAGRSPIPNQSMANGAQARGEIGLRNWMSGLLIRSTDRQRPRNIHKGIAIRTAR